MERPDLDDRKHRSMVGGLKSAGQQKADSGSNRNFWELSGASLPQREVYQEGRQPTNKTRRVSARALGLRRNENQGVTPLVTARRQRPGRGRRAGGS